MQELEKDITAVVEMFSTPEADLQEDEVKAVAALLEKAKENGSFQDHVYENSLERQGAMLNFVHAEWDNKTKPDETAEEPATEEEPETTEEETREEVEEPEDSDEPEEENEEDIVDAIHEFMQEPWMEGHEGLGQRLFEVATEAMDANADVRQSMLVVAADEGVDVPKWMLEDEPEATEEEEAEEEDPRDSDPEWGLNGEEPEATEEELDPDPWEPAEVEPIIPPEPELTESEMNDLLLGFKGHKPMFESVIETAKLTPSEKLRTPIGLDAHTGEEITPIRKNRNGGPVRAQVINADDLLARVPETRSIFVRERKMQIEIDQINELYDETMELLNEYKLNLNKVNVALKQRLE